MKYLFSFIVILITLGFTLPKPNYHYTIGLLAVDNIGAAKEATEYMRDMFQQFPMFNDSTDVFEFESTILVQDSAFRAESSNHGYNVIKFEREPK